MSLGKYRKSGRGRSEWPKPVTCFCWCWFLGAECK